MILSGAANWDGTQQNHGVSRVNFTALPRIAVPQKYSILVRDALSLIPIGYINEAFAIWLIKKTFKMLRSTFGKITFATAF